MKRLAICLFMGLSVVAMATPDSTTIVSAVKEGGSIFSVLIPKPWIPGVDNSIVSGLIVTIVSYMISLFHHRKSMKAIQENVAG